VGYAGRDSPGDTESLEFALVLMAVAILIAFAGCAIGVGAARLRPALLVVAATAIILGIIGLAYMVLVSLVVAGMFPDLLVTPTNLSVLVVLFLMAVTGIAQWRLIRSGPIWTLGPDAGWLARSWHPLVAGFRSDLPERGYGACSSWTSSPRTAACTRSRTVTPCAARAVLDQSLVAN
jgi:hypothetical protein